MKKIKIVLIALLALILIQIKSSTASVVHKGQESFEQTVVSAAYSLPDTSTWVLSKIHGSKSKQHAGNKLFIHINTAEKKISGYTSCNFIRGKVSVKDTVISIAEITLGKRVCDEATSVMEMDFVKTIEKATSWKVSEGILYLYDKGILIMEFKTAGGK
jgi:heat shock protein HslJ